MMNDTAELLSRLRVAEIMLDNLPQDQSQDGSILIIDSTEASRISTAISEAVSAMAAKEVRIDAGDKAIKQMASLIENLLEIIEKLAGKPIENQDWDDANICIQARQYVSLKN